MVAPFFAYWASRFISFSNENNSAPLDDRIRLYLDFLKVSELREEWQIRQAGDAIRLYIDHFLDGDRTIFATVKGAIPAFLDDLKSDAMKRMRETLRIQNYAYRTEKTYIDWVNRYFSYCKSVNAPVTGRDASDSRFSSRGIFLNSLSPKDAIPNSKMRVFPSPAFRLPSYLQSVSIISY
jgi:hypothetical protein